MTATSEDVNADKTSNICANHACGGRRGAGVFIRQHHTAPFGNYRESLLDPAQNQSERPVSSSSAGASRLSVGAGLYCGAAYEETVATEAPDCCSDWPTMLRRPCRQ